MANSSCISHVFVNPASTEDEAIPPDGLSYMFVIITHEGVLKEFNIMDGNLSSVLGCLQYILAMATCMSPTWNGLEAGGDDPITQMTNNEVRLL